MAVAVKRLDVAVGDLVEIDERRYEVATREDGGVTLEPVITKSVAELRAARGSDGLTGEQFEGLFGDLPSDGEG